MNICLALTSLPVFTLSTLSLGYELSCTVPQIFANLPHPMLPATTFYFISTIPSLITTLSSPLLTTTLTTLAFVIPDCSVLHRARLLVNPSCVVLFKFMLV